MMKKTLAVLLGLTLLTVQGCVGAKVYKAEKYARVAAEAREKVLVQEVLNRRSDATGLVKNVGDLNRTIGQQGEVIEDLQTELAARTQSMGESASKLSSEKAALEKQLSGTQEQLNQCNSLMEKIKAVQDKRKAILSELQSGLIKISDSFKDAAMLIATEDETVTLTLQDKSLFDASGLVINASGKKILQSLAEFIAARPSLDIDVLAYTDNVLLPKEKTLKDTWDWSLQRATTVVRMLIREYNTNANQLTPVAKGEFYPLTSNETAEGRAKNRRTVLVFKAVLPAVPAAE